MKEQREQANAVTYGCMINACVKCSQTDTCNFALKNMFFCLEFFFGGCFWMFLFWILRFVFVMCYEVGSKQYWTGAGGFISFL